MASRRTARVRSTELAEHRLPNEDAAIIFEGILQAYGYNTRRMGRSVITDAPEGDFTRRAARQAIYGADAARAMAGTSQAARRTGQKRRRSQRSRNR